MRGGERGSETHRVGRHAADSGRRRPICGRRQVRRSPCMGQAVGEAERCMAINTHGRFEINNVAHWHLELAAATRSSLT